MVKRGERQRERSQSQIKKAFSQLLAEKAYCDIQVSEIIARANVGRTTFYRYYGGKVDILTDMHIAIFADLMSHFNTRSAWLADQPSAGILRFLKLGETLRHRASSVSHYLGSDLGILTQQLNATLTQALKRQLTQVFQEAPSAFSLDFLANAISALYVTQILRWLVSETLTEDAETFARSIQRASAALIHSAFEAPDTHSPSRQKSI